MDIFSILRGSKKKAAPTSNNTWDVIVGPGGGTDSVNERNLLANNKEWVFIAVDKVASSVAAVRLKVMRYKRNGDDQEVFDGPLVQFLENPGPGFTGTDFVYLNTVYKELTGNAFWERTKGRSVYPLIPTSVSPHVVAGKMAGYKVADGGQVRTLRLEDVLHDRYIDPARPYWGAGKLQKIARWVDTSSFSNEFLRRFFLNGATFGGFIENDFLDSEESARIFRANLLNDHVGVENAHKLAVLPKGAKYSQSTANMNDIEMGATDDRYRDKILAGFGVPKTLVGLTTEVNRASAEAAEYVFARYTVKPVVDDLVSFLNTNVAKVYDPNGEFYFAYDEFVPANMEHELKEREISLNRQPYRTVNEVRAQAGLPPVPGGDVIYGNPGQVPLGTPQQAPEQADDEEDDTDNAQPVKSRPRSIPARVRANVERRGRIGDLVDTVAQKLQDITETAAVDPDALAHKDFVGRVLGYSEQLDAKVKEFNNLQLRRIELDLQSIISPKAVSQTDLWDMQEEVEIMVDMTTPILGALLTEQALAEFEAQGFGGKLDTGADILKQTVDRAAKRLGRSYNRTTARLLKVQLNEGLAEGESMGELVKRVQSVYEFSDLVRAKQVAHTESFYIANKANEEAYRQSGVVKTKRWYTAEDEMICEFCKPMHGRVVDVQKQYFKKGDTYTVIDIAGKPQTMSLGYRSIDVPPLHTNCRCFIRPDIIEIE